ncbi:unnamed protein product [Lactuca virosa]|uniref:Uncharacterized protein n=1 Tax=Lactuca virosa TaxID=75947 RepID=A0AAU9N248_9ASTR|nr:unnamed protein product [Lactuca virosa]
MHSAKSEAKSGKLEAKSMTPSFEVGVLLHYRWRIVPYQTDVVLQLEQNKQVLIDDVVHAANEDYAEMAYDFTRLGFLARGTDKCYRSWQKQNLLKKLFIQVQ